ncbi:hypothetical protein [Bacteroides sp.]|uniref:hypothetical protein n=1 Tax=Bacteroides sp. TaxID=29523 RepID=UPI00262A2E91|nr:hypothetical protein [Bacteroides sp.]MDD3037225.1 hypothetical protein [Bacteroides sp.]
MKEQEPTMILCPDAANVTERDLYYDLQRTMLNHFGNPMFNRVFILDIFEGYKDSKDLSGNVVDEFRNNIGNSYLDFKVAYYPWLNTSVAEERDLTLLNIVTKALKTILEEYKFLDSQKRTIHMEQINKIDAQMDMTEKIILHTILMQNSHIYKERLKGMKQIVNLLPPSAVMAGIYTLVAIVRPAEFIEITF